MKKWITSLVLVVSIVCFTGIAFAAVTPIAHPGSGFRGYPVRITQSGSYQLQSNLSVTANTTAILVTADNVTIDLNGFAIIGPNVCTGIPLVCNNNGTGRGIDATDKQNIKIYNGTVRGMGNIGILSGNGSIIESVRVASNGNYGIIVHDSSTVSGNTVTGNGSIGIYVYDSSTVSGNTVIGNAVDGIYVNGSGTVSGNTVTGNGVAGIYVTGGGIVSGNTVAGNGGNGLGGFSVGYFNNVFNNNTGGDVGGVIVNLGHNLCSGVLCP